MNLDIKMGQVQHKEVLGRGCHPWYFNSAPHSTPMRYGYATVHFTIWGTEAQRHQVTWPMVIKKNGNREGT